ncbi:MAG: hypothetical protein IT381_25975 [Deltaproteobacteria bacterium]|nr:hypothetical protein [Deltaproteobacteria bacterium]
MTKTEISRLARTLSRDGAIDAADATRLAEAAEKNGLTPTEKIAIAGVLDRFEDVTTGRARQTLRQLVCPVVYLGTSARVAQRKLSTELVWAGARSLGIGRKEGKPTLEVRVRTQAPVPLLRAMLVAGAPNVLANIVCVGTITPR